MVGLKRRDALQRHQGEGGVSEIAFIVKFGAAHGVSSKIKKEISRKNYGGTKGALNGYCISKVKPAGFKIWINSRQTDREMVDSFFHEMTHALLKIRFAKKPLKISYRHAEALCCWIGYLAKQQFGDMFPHIFGRKIERGSKR